MIFVFAGTLLIVINHLVRYFLRKKKGEQVVVERNNKLFGIVSTLIIIAVSAALIIPGTLLMINNPFNAVVAYNSFNVGLIILVLGCSALLSLGISLPILIDGIKTKVAFNE